MPRPQVVRLAARQDSNHSDVRGWYEELGCSFADTSRVGFGLPDGFVGCAGITDPVEVKSEDGELQSAQTTFIERWRGSKVWVPRTRDDVIAHVTDMRKRARRAG